MANRGLIVNVRFADGERKVSISSANYERLTLSEEVSRPPSPLPTTTRSCLTTLEASRVARTLEKWVNRFRLQNTLDGAENDEPVADSNVGHGGDDKTGPTKMAKLWAFVPKILEQTAKELRLSGTFVTLQRTNDLMLKATVDERELEKKLSSNRAKLNDLRTKKNKYKELYNVIIPKPRCRAGLFSRLG